ncbi:hypothetical protein ACQPW3_38215 [Actinosynnema sp. CA-248983]
MVAPGVVVNTGGKAPVGPPPSGFAQVADTIKNVGRIFQPAPPRPRPPTHPDGHHTQPHGPVLKPSANPSAMDVDTLKGHITQAVQQGAPVRARILLNRLSGTDLHPELQAHFDQEVAANPSVPPVDVPKQVNFVWFGNTPKPGAVDNMVEWAGKARQTDGQWKITLWTDQGAANWARTSSSSSTTPASRSRPAPTPW